MLHTSEVAGYQEYVDITFVHMYTRESVSNGTVDDWKMAKPEYADPVVDILCNYLSDGLFSLRDKGVLQIDTPTISVKNDDPIKVGDRVTNIKDALGTVVLEGPLYVEIVTPAMGFGVVTNKVVNLTGHSPVKW